jgi:hypothetical protein
MGPSFRGDDTIVIAGPPRQRRDPAIQRDRKRSVFRSMDARIKSAHDGM